MRHKRFQSRRGNGRFQRNTLANTFGLRAGICEECRRLNPSHIGDPVPLVCQHCGEKLEKHHPESKP